MENYKVWISNIEYWISKLCHVPKFIYDIPMTLDMNSQMLLFHFVFCHYILDIFTSNTFLSSLTLSASIHARLSRLGNYTAGFMFQCNFLCRWNRRKNVKTFLDPIQTAWKFIAKHFSIVGKNECKDHDQWNFKFKVKIL